ncbi:MAG TPA: xanthine dehydrogenase family protein molybdopterin-binding subunit [Geminicoccus sp.]|jgi:isoquinoline 1-oxidoreductase beta subunit|uniref:xanthine dehydrogenase family protein molybdopterin-binding subunit n=1 Tax=Geminicoccus sp. TaxID=2024832 RepID=UPI002E37294F|nr:xanthine dehydrogenase family protein molybdopterin-binding subunit [Geminicoccus sp.]HEX2528102.1 xanthine dehydrogenase family protein molybdopterin-binding subunit [Geminicoccus sp.]
MKPSSTGPSFARIMPEQLTEPTRRRFLQVGGLLLAFAAMGRQKARAAGEQPGLRSIQNVTGGGDTGDAFQGFAPGGFIRIGRDGRIDLIAPNVEMGQGIYTAEAMLIAEELEVGLDQVGVLAAPADEELYKQPLLQSQSTGGSTSIRGAWVPLRQAGAAARMMLIAAAAEQWNVPVEECTAERAVVRHGATGRTLGYGELADAAGRRPVPQDVPLKEPKDWTLIGTSAHRVDSPGKVDGTAIFGLDVRLPDMKVAAVAACPVFGGTLASVDDKAARGVPGVRDIITIENAVAVTADHYWAAKRGLEALEITWEEGKHAHLSSAEIVQDLRDAFGRVPAVVARHDGDADAALAGAAKRVEAAYELPFLAHATMEPINTTVHVRPDACEIWVGTQVPTVAQATAARITGLPPEKVLVHNQLLGGGFGRRLVADSVAQAVQIAKQVPYPVKVVWSREEDIQHDFYRPAYFDRLTAGLDAEGMPIAWIDHVTGGSVMGSYFPGGLPEGKLDADAVEGAIKPPYDLPVVHVDWTRKDPPVPITWWRGVGPTHNVHVVETFIDEIAYAVGRDPVEYRRALLGNNPRGRAVLDLATEKAGWGTPLAAGRGRGVSLHDSFGSHLAVVAEVEVSPLGDVRLLRVVAAIDCGLTVNPDTVAAQIEGGLVFGFSAALYSDITFSGGRVEQSNFHDYRMMRINETPPIEVHQIRNEEDPGGIGETGTVSAAPALGNAIFAATGKRLRRYPFDRRSLLNPDLADKVAESVPPGAIQQASAAP